MNTNKRWNLLIVVALVLIIIYIIVASLVILKLKVTNKKSDESASGVKTEIAPSDPKEKYCFYAKKTLDWLDKNRDKDGRYYLSVSCNSNKKTCSDFTESGKSGHNAMVALWSRYQYFLKTNDQSELVKLKKDIDTYYQQLEIMPVQNDFWNCKLLTDLMDDKYLGSDYSDKINKLCESSNYLYTNNIYGDYAGENNFEIKTTNIPYINWKNISKQQLQELKKTYNISDGHCSPCVSYSSDLIARYNKFNKTTDLDQANAYFNELLIQYYIDPYAFSDADKCLMAISSLDLYSINQDQMYINWSNEVYKSLFNNQQIKPEARVPECAYLNRELSKIDNSQDYSAYQSQLLDYFISQYWDSNNGKNLTGEGGFFKVNSQTDNKNLRENALIVNLLCP